MDTFIGGLLSILTPMVFPFLITIPVIFERLGKSIARHKANTALFGILTVLVFVFSISKILTLDNISAVSNYFFAWEIAVELILLIFLGWFLLTFSRRFERYRNGNWLMVFGILGVGLLSYRLALASFSATGPILGYIFMSDLAGAEKAKTIWLLFTFSLGLVLPFVILQYLISKQYSKLKSKQWWKILQIIVAGILVLGVLGKVLYYIMLANTDNLA